MFILFLYFCLTAISIKLHAEISLKSVFWRNARNIYAEINTNIIGLVPNGTLNPCGLSPSLHFRDIMLLWLSGRSLLQSSPQCRGHISATKGALVSTFLKAKISLIAHLRSHRRNRIEHTASTVSPQTVHTMACTHIQINMVTQIILK